MLVAVKAEHFGVMDATLVPKQMITQMRVGKMDLFRIVKDIKDAWGIYSRYRGITNGLECDPTSPLTPLGCV